MKRFENSPLDKEFKEQTDIAKKQYQRLNNAFISNKDNENVNESLIKKEPVAKSIAKKKYNLSQIKSMIDSVYTVIVMIKKLIAFLLNQNIHIYIVISIYIYIFMMICKSWLRWNQQI